MAPLLLAALLSTSPAPPAELATLERASRVLDRCLDLEGAVRRLEAAEEQLAAAVTKGERRRAWAAWMAARAELRVALRAGAR